MSKFRKIANTSIFVLFLFSITCTLNKNLVSVNQHYSLRKLLEKPITNNFQDTSLYLFHSRVHYVENYFTLVDRDFSLTPDIPSPVLVKVDKKGNYYIHNAYENLKIFDREGTFLYKFDFPDGYNGFYFSPFNEQNNLYMFLKKEINNTVDTVAYKIDALDKTSTILDKKNITQLDKTLLPPENGD